MFRIFVLSVGDFAILNAPKYSSTMLFNVPKHKKTVMYLRRKVCVLYKLHVGVSYNAVDCELNVDESAVYTK